MQEQKMQHRDGRTAVAATPTERVILRAQGFVLVEPEAVEAPSADWSHDQLDAYAVARNFDLAGAKTRADKVAAIEAAQKAADEAAPPAGD